MFVQSKQLTHLAVPASKIDHLHMASSSVQLALAGFPPQPCRAYLLQLTGGGKAMVVVAFYLAESDRSVYFIPRQGEVAQAEAEAVYEKGYEFVETMGFHLMETDFHLLRPAERQGYWEKLPISKPPAASAAGVATKIADEIVPESAEEKCLASLGRFLASM
jgi:hypothetical protein